MNAFEIYRMADVLQFDDERFCEECGYPLNQCKCEKKEDEDAEGPEAA